MKKLFDKRCTRKQQQCGIVVLVKTTRVFFIICFGFKYDRKIRKRKLKGNQLICVKLRGTIKK